MIIDQMLLLEPGLKGSFRKYKAIGKTGMVAGKKCTPERLEFEISETLKCFCDWSQCEAMRDESAKADLRNYLLGISKI